MSFYGYIRENGWVGTRNFVGVISIASCTNDPANWIAAQIDGCIPFGQDTACGNGSRDQQIYIRTMINIGKNPNLGAVLLVGPACECQDINMFAREIRTTGKRVEAVTIHGDGSILGGMMEGMRLAQQLSREISGQQRVECDDSMLRYGLTCGGSTPISGISTNAVMGRALDFLIERGGCGGFTETTEIIGAEHIMIARAATPAVAQKMEDTVCYFRKRFSDCGVDVCEGNPSLQNISDGLSSLEEKALGAISKAGSTPLREVCAYGERPDGPGLFFIDSPGNDLACMVALLAAGCTVISYSSESACPYGVPFVPVIKVTANQEHMEKYSDILDYHIDINDAVTDLDAVSERFYAYLMRVSSGEKTRGEILRYYNYNRILTVNPLY